MVGCVCTQRPGQILFRRADSRALYFPLVALRAVVFDLDDTLVALHAAKRRAYDWIASQGVDTKRMREAEARLWRAFADGKVSYQELRRERWEACGIPWSRAQQMDVEFLRLSNGVYCRPGARGVLHELRQQGLKLAVLTNANSTTQRGKLERCRLNEYMDAVGISEELGVGKPDRRAFDAICEMLDADPAECAMVGDDLFSDVRGGIEAGFQRVIWCPTPGRIYSEAPPPGIEVISRLSELPAKLGHSLPEATQIAI